MWTKDIISEAGIKFQQAAGDCKGSVIVKLPWAPFLNLLFATFDPYVGWC